MAITVKDKILKRGPSSKFVDLPQTATTATLKSPPKKVVNQYQRLVEVRTMFGEVMNVAEVYEYADGTTTMKSNLTDSATPIEELVDRIPGIMPPGTTYEFLAVTQKQYCIFDYSTVKPMPTKPYVVGILPTKDDGDIVCEWIHHNIHHFDVLIVVDGSEDSLTEQVFSPIPNVVYTHERDHPDILVTKLDSEMRMLGQEIAKSRFGDTGYWIHIAHTDEFLYHSPRKVFRAAEKAGADAIKWHALHIIPHTSEFERYQSNRYLPVHKLFQHYYFFEDKRDGAFKESRSFQQLPYQKYVVRWCEVVPDTVKKYWNLSPSYMHYKLWNLTLDAYTADGVHKHHWNRVDEKHWEKLEKESADKAASKGQAGGGTFKRGVGTRMSMEKIEDFFKDDWPACCKYKSNSVFDGKLLPSLNKGNIFDSRSLIDDV
eukprot:CAMPEP_0198197298 /NCGR_PEP_ID=MMETSP1445-20131203/903_1 /TAXON_ID=36898 /ORGANISM="Pyramimonas sp., Strain CCMP2087" /LENGTH=428 /DNA_ID=CAMNT_0043866547 /DNA_START=386 /DNA_END=1670 /DNA_ORIENTATION=-